MGLQLTSNQTNAYQKHFAKRFISTLKDTLVMEQFAQKRTAPSGQGADTVRFFVEPEANMADVIAPRRGHRGKYHVLHQRPRGNRRPT